MAEKKQQKKPAEKPAKKQQDTLPEWSNSTTMAQLLGKGVRRIQQMTQEGIIETQVPPTGGARKYHTCETVQRYIAHIEKKAQESGSGSHELEMKLQKMEAEITLKKSQGQLHQLKTAIVEGKYIETRTASQELAEFLEIFRRTMDTIPTRVAATLSGYTDKTTCRMEEKNLRREIDGLLTSFIESAAVGTTQAEDTEEDPQ